MFLLLSTAATGLALQPSSAAVASLVHCRSPQPRLQAPYLSSRKEAASRQLSRVVETRAKVAQTTLARVALPTLLSTLVAYVYFDNLSLLIRSTLEDGTIRLVARDEAQFIQNFLTSMGLLFTILAGTAYSALYRQQEDIYEALYSEVLSPELLHSLPRAPPRRPFRPAPSTPRQVTEAKSLLEQLCLIGAGRPFYGAALRCMQGYVKDDLRRLDIPPAELLSRKPMNDPLEQIMLMTSVGVPSVIYDTLKDLRLARAYRLGAMQRKFPFLGIARPARCSAWPRPRPRLGWVRPWPRASLRLVLVPQLAPTPPTPGWHACLSPLAPSRPLAGRLARRDLRRGPRRRRQPGPESPLWAASDAPRPASAAGAALPAGVARAARLPAARRGLLRLVRRGRGHSRAAVTPLR